MSTNDAKTSVDSQKRIEKVQRQRTWRLASRTFVRVRYGDEQDDWGADQQTRGDCGVVKGQFHVSGCNVEHCPRCGGQTISCDCE